MPCLVSFHPSSSHAFWRWKASKDGGWERKCRLYLLWQNKDETILWALWVGSLIYFFPLFWFSVDLLDTSTAQGELGWLPDPPEVGVSTHIQGRGATGSTEWWKNIIHVEIAPSLWKSSFWKLHLLLDILCFISLSPFTCADSPLASFLRTDAYWLPVWLNISLKYTVSMK